MIINQKKFTLRSYRRKDENALRKNINDKIISKCTIDIPYPYKLKDAREWIDKNLKLDKLKKKVEINWAIEINGEAVGGIGLDKITNHKAEIGYWLGRRYRGQGIMTKAVKLITAYAFKELRLRRIYAFVFTFNQASVRVLEKAGYKFEGKLRKNFFKKGKTIDSLLFAKIK